MDENQLKPSEEQPSYEKNEPEKTINYNTNYNTNYYRDGKKHGCIFWGIIIAVIIFALFAAIAAAFMGAASAVFSFAPQSETAYIDSDYVETLYIKGTISSQNVNSYGVTTGYNHGWLLNEIDTLIEDDLNKGILLYINSGGGGTYESDEMYLALKKYKEKTGRPIYAYYANTAASGAVYISMAADEIYANRMTMTGSIGVMMQYYDAGELMEKLGIKEDNIVSGKNKDMGSLKGLTDEQRDILQSLVDESYEIFVGIVSEERNIPLDKVKEIADGRVYSALQAQKLGLLDYICTYDKFMETMQNKGEFKDCEFVDGYYEDNSIWNMILSKTGMGNTKSFEQQLLERAESANQNPMQYKFEGIGY